MPNTGNGHRRLPTSAAAATTVSAYPIASPWRNCDSPSPYAAVYPTAATPTATAKPTSVAQAGSRRLHRLASRSPTARERALASTVDRLSAPGLLRGAGAPAVEVLGTSRGPVTQADRDPSVGGQVGQVALRGGAGQPELLGEVGRGDRGVGGAHGGDDQFSGLAGSPLAQGGLDVVALVQRPHGPVDVGLPERAPPGQLPAEAGVRAEPFGEVGFGERLDEIVDHAAA